MIVQSSKTPSNATSQNSTSSSAMSIALKNHSPAPASSMSNDKKKQHFPGDPRFGIALSAVALSSAKTRH
jgi:hypothetical protein